MSIVRESTKAKASCDILLSILCEVVNRTVEVMGSEAAVATGGSTTPHCHSKKSYENKKKKKRKLEPLVAYLTCCITGTRDQLRFPLTNRSPIRRLQPLTSGWPIRPARIRYPILIGWSPVVVCPWVKTMRLVLRRLTAILIVTRHLWRMRPRVNIRMCSRPRQQVWTRPRCPTSGTNIAKQRKSAFRVPRCVRMKILQRYRVYTSP